MQNRISLHPLRQTGSALIVALLIVTLVATVATVMTLQQQTQTARTALILNNDRSYLYAKAVEDWAMFTLLTNLQQAKEDKGNTGKPLQDVVIDVLPKSFDEIVINHTYHITGQIDDAQGRFNLNNLTKTQYERQFMNLMLAVDPDLDPDDAKAIAKATHDWVSKPKSSNQNNTVLEQASTPANSIINRFYTKRNPPYRAAQALMTSASELRLVKGMTPNLYLRLQPFIIALPKRTPVNINTASAPVIASLGTGMNLSDALQIVQNRLSSPFTRTTDFLTDSLVQRTNITAADITLNSDYFLVTSETRTDSEKTTLSTLLYRPLKTDQGDNNTDSSDNTTESDKKVNATMQNEKQESQKPITILWESRGGI